MSDRHHMIVTIVENDDQEGARSRITLPDVLVNNIRNYYVKESVQEICAAVNDCADATDQGGR